MTTDKSKLPDPEKVQDELLRIASQNDLSERDYGYLEAADRWLDHVSATGGNTDE